LSKATAQWGVLRDIYFSGDHCLSQSEIVRIRNVTSANVTRLIHGLEKAGLVKRDVNPNDKRSTRVRLTEAGVAVCQALVPVIVDSINSAGAPFSEDELRQLNGYLSRLQAHVEKVRAARTAAGAALVNGQTGKRARAAQNRNQR
jgi:DNA-binding MarR family transcriptional regulator